MDSRTGKKIRRNRLFNPHSGRTVIIAYSHASFMGPMPGLRTRQELLRNALALRDADGLMVSPGLVNLLEQAFLGPEAPSLVVQIDWQSFSRTTLPYETGACASMTTVEQVAAAGGDVVMSYLYLGHPDPEIEKEEISRNAALVRDCERFGLLLMIEPRSAVEKTQPETKHDPALMCLYARISAEIGADLVKVIDPGEDEALAEIAASCPAPVLLAGGAQKADFESAIARARAAMQAGWAGLVYGRNIFQHENPAAALGEVLRVVHEKGDGAPGVAF